MTDAPTRDNPDRGLSVVSSKVEIRSVGDGLVGIGESIDGLFKPAEMLMETRLQRGINALVLRVDGPASSLDFLRKIPALGYNIEIVLY